jgi:methionyl-tRNA formyltransferase
LTVAVLTTDTTHHAWFVRALRSTVDVGAVFLEEEVLAPPEGTHHPFEDARAEYERSIWFDSSDDGDLWNGAPVHRVRRMNDTAAVDALRRARPSIVLVFGTRKLSDEVIGVCPDGIMNLHGGDPRRHRGLDSHLWAIHDGAFDALVVTLHRVSGDLDAGDIIAQRPVPVSRGMLLHELRRRNTETCLGLCLEAIRRCDRHSAIDAAPQAKSGAYFSFMPAALKERVVRSFNRYTRRLP